MTSRPNDNQSSDDIRGQLKQKKNNNICSYCDASIEIGRTRIHSIESGASIGEKKRKTNSKHPCMAGSCSQVNGKVKMIIAKNVTRDS